MESFKIACATQHDPVSKRRGILSEEVWVLLDYPRGTQHRKDQVWTPVSSRNVEGTSNKNGHPHTSSIIPYSQETVQSGVHQWMKHKHWGPTVQWTMIQRNQLSENHLTPIGNEPQARAIVQGKLSSLVLSEKKPEWKMCFDSADPEQLKCYWAWIRNTVSQTDVRNMLKNTESHTSNE